MPIYFLLIDLLGKVKNQIKMAGAQGKEIEQPLSNAFLRLPAPLTKSSINMVTYSFFARRASKVTDFQQIDLGDSPYMGHKANFFFNVPEFLTLPSDEQRLQYMLPPSIRVIKPTRHIVSGNCDVIYYMEARIFRLGNSRSHTSFRPISACWVCCLLPHGASVGELCASVLCRRSTRVCIA
jgi:hypothetical protein